MKNKNTRIALLLSMAALPVLIATASEAGIPRPQQGGVILNCNKLGVGFKCVWVRGRCVRKVPIIVCKDKKVKAKR